MKAGISLLSLSVCRWVRTWPLWVMAAITAVAARSAVWEPRSVVPSTAMTFRPRAGALRSGESRRWGGRIRPVSGSGRKPGRARTRCGASATNSPAADLFSDAEWEVLKSALNRSGNVSRQVKREVVNDFLTSGLSQREFVRRYNGRYLGITVSQSQLSEPLSS